MRKEILQSGHLKGTYSTLTYTNVHVEVDVEERT